jgi:hypothetical protein
MGFGDCYSLFLKAIYVLEFLDVSTFALDKVLSRPAHEHGVSKFLTNSCCAATRTSPQVRI